MQLCSDTWTDEQTKGGRRPMRLDRIAGHELTHSAQQAEDASWQRHVPERNVGKGGPARSGDCVRTGHMVAMTVETREVVGDKKIRSQVFDEHSDICGELVNVLCKLTIAETRVDNFGDAEDARRALGLSAPAVCECRLHNAGRIPSLSAGEHHKGDQRTRRREAMQRSATGDGLIVRMREYRHNVLEAAYISRRNATVRCEKQRSSPEVQQRPRD